MKITENPQSFDATDAIPPSPHGMDAPFFIKTLSCEYPGFTRIEMHDGGVATIGSCGIQTYTNKETFLDGFPAHHFSLEDVPVDGWEAEEIWCDISYPQTGGFCMVDVVKFSNEWVATVTDESIILNTFKAYTDWPPQDDAGIFAEWDNGGDSSQLKAKEEFTQRHGTRSIKSLGANVFSYQDSECSRNGHRDTGRGVCAYCGTFIDDAVDQFAKAVDMVEIVAKPVLPPSGC